MHHRVADGLTPDSFENLVNRFRDRVYGFSVRYLGDKEEAADATQEVFIRMWQHRSQIDTDRAMAWLLRVARNVCIDAIRKRRAYTKRVETDSDTVYERADPGPLPDRQASASQFRDRLEQALERLDEPQKSIVILREIEGFKYEEISQTLELPLNTVKVYLHRARKALRRELKETYRYEYV